MKGKQGKTQNWLPSQVTYGVDCSDPDPANWKAFGTEVSAADELAADDASVPAAKHDRPRQPAPAER